MKISHTIEYLPTSQLDGKFYEKLHKYMKRKNIELNLTEMWQRPMPTEI